jgi:divalent metal cation (Fe/Co/Zn/Cd) transporter
MSHVSSLAAVYIVFLSLMAVLLVRISRRRPAGEWPYDEIPDLYAGFAYTLLVLAGLVLVVVAIRHGTEPRAPAYLGSAAAVLAGVVVGVSRRVRRPSRTAR